jgi:hypothetical protein
MPVNSSTPELSARPERSPFETPFFRALPKGGNTTIEDHSGAPRVYAFPTCFTHTASAIVLTTADYDAAQDRVPQALRDAGLTPVRVSRNRCIAVLGSYRYGRVNDGMTGYNEMVVGIALAKSKALVLPAVLRTQFGFGAFVLDLPVDSAENCVRGNAIWGLPKSMKTFAYAESSSHYDVRLSEAEGQLCMHLQVPIGGRRMLVRDENCVYSVKDGKALQTRAVLEGACWQYAGIGDTSRIHLEFGNHGVYAELRKLDFHSKPLVVRLFDSQNSALYLPEAVSIK